ncbi:MAG: GlsB/YeaQ/YmgE family stress response membrane protein [Muribaculaceae bacterium]|nr:GlsB/YeaQ/YmgE family stress response membrane protein [Muribaculaceae bacterium]MDE6009362.1 GlsB/YeaQ/YmgE family stress response membrane protein [Muribaculaceae bacterium]MDE6793037.1 GlsB/YeaQ/YmgE family stress response membrane protein [Muribaculaceae bacterium]
MNFIWYIIIGIVSGAVAGKLMRGGGFGWIVNLVVGIIGGVLGGWIFGILGIHTSSIIGSLITSVVGAIFLLWIVGWLSKSNK